MSVAQAVQLHRPVEDINEDIAAIIRRFHPLAQSRHFFTYEVTPEGVVRFSGHIKSQVAQKILLDSVARIPGVSGVDISDLHTEEELRIAVGRVLPPGVRARVDYGDVILVGKLPPRHKVETLVKKVASIPGVVHVQTALED
ncbi:MAG: hypothetical protein Kow0077_31980 [Anaerolineae bacterium]